MTTRVIIRNDSQPGQENSHSVRVIEQSKAAAPERLLGPGQTTEYHLHDGNQLVIRELTSPGPGINWTELNPPERSRTYVYPEGEGNLTYENVVRLEVRASGTHRLETADGKKVFVRPGWKAVEIDTDEWTC